MNLAQLIDPEWVREGSPRWFTPVRPPSSTPTPILPEQTVAHEMEPDTPLRRSREQRSPRGRVLTLILGAVERICGANKGGASLAEIAKRLDRAPEDVSGSVRNYFDAGYLDRSGEAYHYRYTLTADGRAYLKVLRNG